VELEVLPDVSPEVPALVIPDVPVEKVPVREEDDPVLC
jgi:hypothetical protein